MGTETIRVRRGLLCAVVHVLNDGSSLAHSVGSRLRKYSTARPQISFSHPRASSTRTRNPYAQLSHPLTALQSSAFTVCTLRDRHPESVLANQYATGIGE